MKNNLGEKIISILLIILLILFLNPWHFWMPSMLVMSMLLVFILLFFLFAGIIWKEKPRDEREEIHSLKSGRAAYLGGIAILVIGVVWQEYKGSLDPWLIYALGIMIIIKLSTRVYQNKKN